MPCFMLRALASLVSNAAISASMSESMVAMAVRAFSAWGHGNLKLLERGQPQRIYRCLDRVLHCVRTEVLRHIEVNIPAGHVWQELADGVDTLMHIETAGDVVEDASDAAFAWHETASQS